jgi:hypothetical protein
LALENFDVVGGSEDLLHDVVAPDSEDRSMVAA